MLTGDFDVGEESGVVVQGQDSGWLVAPGVNQLAVAVLFNDATCFLARGVSGVDLHFKQHILSCYG